MSTALLILLLCQNVDSNPAMRASAEAQKRDAALHQVSHLTKPVDPAPAVTADEQFVGKFNNLIERLVDFAENYRTKQAVDVKKAKAVRQAWLELEKSEAVFQDSGSNKK